MKLYERDFIAIQYARRLHHVLEIKTDLGVAQRRALQNNSDFMLLKSEAKYTSNNPAQLHIDTLAYPTHKAAWLQTQLRIFLGATYSSLPNKREYNTSHLPEIGLMYKLTGVENQTKPVHHMRVSARQNDVNLGITGALSWYAGLGTSLSTGPILPLEYTWYFANSGNFSFAPDPLMRFQVMPFHIHATKGSYAQLNIEHNFKGILFDKIPGIKKLKLTELVTAKTLYHIDTDKSLGTTQAGYTEFSVGLGNLGFKALRIFRLDYVVAPALYPGSEVIQRFVFGVQSGLSVKI